MPGAQVLQRRHVDLALLEQGACGAREPKASNPGRQPDSEHLNFHVPELSLHVDGQSR
jgi:hypothetical protein